MSHEKSAASTSYHAPRSFEPNHSTTEVDASSFRLTHPLDISSDPDFPNNNDISTPPAYSAAHHPTSPPPRPNAPIPSPNLPNLNYSLYLPPSFTLSTDKTKITSNSAHLSNPKTLLPLLKSLCTIPPENSMTGTTQSKFPEVILGTPCQVNHTEQTHERDNSPPFILSSPTPSQPFNFQTQRNTLSSDDPFKSPINRPTFQFNKKRRRQPSHSEPHINSPKEAIQKARSLLILAASLEEDTEEQSKVLDLIEIFREYLEKGKLTKASNIITSQISHLENATKRIEKQANHLSNLPNHTIPPTINTPGTKANYATITKTSGEWNLVTKGKLLTSWDLGSICIYIA